MKKTIGLLVLSILLPAWSASAVDAAGSPALEIKATAEVDVTIKKADGSEEVKRVPATRVPPGEAVIYTVSARNTADKPASDVIVTDPIPEHMEYVDGSVSADGTRVTFSVDGGKTFAAKEALRVRGTDGELRAALPADFTHIRWQFEKPLAPGETRAVSFRARVE
jgi:uncharacterized repeat protein (TIGR01451 family)